MINSGDAESIDAARLARKQQQIGTLIDKIQKAREAGNLHSALDFCREWLQIEPQSDRAREIIGMIENTVSREREDQVVINRCRDLVLQQHYREALDLLETLDPESAQGDSIRELKKNADQAIRMAHSEAHFGTLLEEISRLLFHGHLDLARARLDELKTYDMNDINILRRKLDRALEIRAAEKELTIRLHEALKHADMDQARTWLGMISELNPQTDIFESLRKSLPPEIYENLTSRITFT